MPPIPFTHGPAPQSLTGSRLTSKRDFRAAAIALACLASGGQALAIGFRLPNHDSEAVARGNAFTATADNPSAIYYNPAGITQLAGHQVSVGSYLIATDFSYRSVTGSTAGTDTTPQAVPHFYYTYSPQESDWSYGFGICAPYGLGVDWGTDNPFPTLAQKAKLLYASVNAVAARRILPNLSAAVGLTFNYSDVELERAIGFSPNDQFRFNGDGHDFGLTFGLLWQADPKWSFGISYRSATEIDYKGRSIAEPYSSYSRTTASIDFPMIIIGGVSFRPNADWNIEMNVDWTDWDVVNDSTFKGGFGGDQVSQFRYDSSFMYSFGITRKLPRGYFVSGGYVYIDNSVPSSSFSPLTPDAILHVGSLGVGHRGDKVEWALAYQLGYNGGREVSGNISQSAIGQTADGEYKTMNHAVSLTVRYKF